MPWDASTKIKILMKTRKAAALNSPWKRCHKIRHTEPCNQAQSRIMRISLFFPFFFPPTP